MKKIVKDALVLFAITLVAGILLGVVYQITLDPIAKANENAKEKAYKAVLAEADSFETIDALPSDDDINASSDIDFSKDKVNEVAIGKKGSETAKHEAEKTLAEVKHAMKIDYFDTPEFLEEQVEKFK